MDKLSTHREVWNRYERKHLATRPASTQRSLRSISKALDAFFGERHPASITQADIDDYVASRPVAAATAAHEVRVMVASWSWASKRRLLDCPTPSFDLPEAHAARTRWLTEAEIDSVIIAAEGAPDPWKLFVNIALDTAARRAAIEELTWSQVDFNARLINFLPDGEQQTSKRRVSVPISDRLHRMLWWHWYVANTGRVCAGLGDALHAVKALGERAGVPGLTPHVFRHTAATHMARRGVPLWTIASILGNTVAQVEKTYAKFQPEFGREAINWRKSA